LSFDCYLPGDFRVLLLSAQPQIRICGEEGYIYTKEKAPRIERRLNEGRSEERVKVKIESSTDRFGFDSSTSRVLREGRCCSPHFIISSRESQI
jgi:hypothetical protein